MAESLDEMLEKLNKLLKPLETEKSKEAAEDLKKSLDAMKKIGKKRKGGSVSRKRGGKIMQGYKAGGKV